MYGECWYYLVYYFYAMDWILRCTYYCTLYILLLANNLLAAAINCLPLFFFTDLPSSPSLLFLPFPPPLPLLTTSVALQQREGGHSYPPPSIPPPFPLTVRPLQRRRDGE